MATKHLKNIWIGWDSSGIPRTPEGRFTPENQKIVHKVEMAVRRIVVLDAYIRNALKAAKVTVGDPPITIMHIILTANVRPELYCDPEPFLCVDIDFDPLELLNLPKDKDKVGELYISFAEEALSKLQSIEGYPVDVIRGACEEFRKNGYNLPFKAGEGMIPGTKIKGRINVVVSPVSTTRYLTVLYRNKPLFQTIISENEESDTLFSQHFAGFELEGMVLTVIGGHEDIVSGIFNIPHVKIDLADYPEVIELMREKGWLDE